MSQLQLTKQIMQTQASIFCCNKNLGNILPTEKNDENKIFFYSFREEF
jgi:hypothetical protein